jgi:hypothetical protein
MRGLDFDFDGDGRRSISDGRDRAKYERAGTWRESQLVRGRKMNEMMAVYESGHPFRKGSKGRMEKGGEGEKRRGKVYTRNPGRLLYAP